VPVEPQPDHGPQPACVGTLLVLILGAGQGVAAAVGGLQRPQAVGLLFFACLLSALSRPVLSRRALVLAPLLVAVWANAHWSFILGLALLAACLVGRLIEAGWRDAQARCLLLVTLLAVGAGMLNPPGARLYAALWQRLRNPNVATLTEAQPPSFRHGFGPHYFYLASLLLLVVCQAVSPRPLGATRLLPAVAFGVAAAVWQSMTAWWVMLAPWAALSLWPAIGERLGWEGFPGELSPRKTLLAAVLVLLAVGLSGPGRWLMRRHPRPLPQAVTAPAVWRLTAELKGEGGDLPELSKALARHYPGGRFHGRVLAGEGLSGCLLWALPPDRFPLLMYGMPHLFAEGHWDDCLNALDGGPAWWELLDRHRVNLLAVEADGYGKLCALLRKDPAWQVVLDEATDPARRGPPGRLLVALRKAPRLAPVERRSDAP
jgi:hypothetical protein